MTREEFLHEMKAVTTIWEACKNTGGKRTEEILKRLVQRMFGLLDEKEKEYE